MWKRNIILINRKPEKCDQAVVLMCQLPNHHLCWLLRFACSLLCKWPVLSYIPALAKIAGKRQIRNLTSGLSLTSSACHFKPEQLLSANLFSKAIGGGLGHWAGQYPTLYPALDFWFSWCRVPSCYVRLGEEKRRKNCRRSNVDLTGVIGGSFYEALSEDLGPSYSRAYLVDEVRVEYCFGGAGNGTTLAERVCIRREQGLQSSVPGYYLCNLSPCFCFGSRLKIYVRLWLEPSSLKTKKWALLVLRIPEAHFYISRTRLPRRNRCIRLQSFGSIQDWGMMFFRDSVIWWRNRSAKVF